MRNVIVRMRANWLARRSEEQRQAGRYGAAEQLCLAAIALAARLSPPDEVRAASLLNNLGVIHKHQGRFAEAAGLYVRALRIAKARVGMEHPLMATLYHNLGGIEHARGRHARGLPFARRAVELRERARGANHPEVAADLAALAALLDGLGRHEESVTLLRRSCAILERQRGADLELSYSLENLAASCFLMGRAAEAEQLAARAISIKRKRLGPRHPELALARSNLAVIRRAGAPPGANDV